MTTVSIIDHNNRIFIQTFNNISVLRRDYIEYPFNRFPMAFSDHDELNSLEDIFTDE